MNFEFLDQLLAKLNSNDNEARKGGEAELAQLWETQPGNVLLGFASLLALHPNPVYRTFSAVLLRKYGSKETPEHKCYLIVLGPQVANEVKSKILSALQTESDSGVRTKIADCASEIARVLLINSSSWPELFQLCGEFYGSGDIQRRKTAFTIFTGCPSMLIKQQDQNMVKSMFIGGLQDPNPEVHFEALRAAVFYLCVAKKDIRNAMADLIPLIFQVIPPSLVDGVRETEAVDAFGSIIELALLHPKMFSGVLSQAVDYLVSQMKNTGLEDATRQICLEFLISLTESSPGMMRKCPQFATSVVPVCLEWMTELEDSSEWYAVETMDDDDDSTNETAGEQAMDRLAIYLGGKIVLPIAFQLIPALLAAPEWQRRHAALRCVSAIGEGCLKLMETELEKVVSLVVPYLRDPHPRVRHAACNAIGQMCTDFSPMIQTQFHSQILPGLIQIMDDLEHCRVANYGAAALVNFSEGSSKATLAPYIETIITKLMVLMNTGKLFMQEQAVTTLATIADSAGNEFVNFYPRIMPIIIQILQLENKKEFRNLKGKTLECGSLIILAVGKEIFGPDATSFIELLGSIQSSITDEDDPQSSYLLSAWARVCKVMGDDFAPYLNLVLPPLLKTAELKPVMFQVSASEADNFKAEDGWDALPMNDDKTLILKTSAIEDKCTAVEMLLCYAQQMGATFHPYVESILQLVIPMFDFALNEGVRYAASSLVPVLFECWIKANYPMEKIQQVWGPLCTAILKAASEEDDLAVACAMYTCIGDTVKTIGTACMTQDQLIKLMEELKKQLEQYMIRSAERQSMRNAADYDPEDEDALQDEEFSDENFLSDIASLISNLFKVFQAHIIPFFEQLLPKLSDFLVKQVNQASSDSSGRQWALCVYCDLIEFTGQSSVNYQQYFLNGMGSGLSDPSPDVRQAASYGVGVAAKFGGPSYSAFCMASLPHLFTLINDAASRAEENVMATENAIAAVAKIISANKGVAEFHMDQVVPHWIKGLPLLNDDDEAKDTYSLLLELLQSNHAALADQDIIRHLAKVLTQTLTSKVLNNYQDISAGLLDALKHILGSLDSNSKTSIAYGLSEPERQFLASNGLV